MSDVDPHLSLPPAFTHWFGQRGWTPRPHQLALAAHVAAGRHAVLIAPTGGGKTLAGFLASLIDLSTARTSPKAGRAHALHTLYVSPLKALTTDIARNLQQPVAEMGLDVSIETRTGDTPPARRQRQRARPPDILLTTPEQLSLFIAQENGAGFFGDLRAIIVDEAHAIAPSKRGDLLALALSAVQRWAPTAARVALSATIDDPGRLARWIAPASGPPARLVHAAPGAPAQVEVLDTDARIPWSGHTGRHALDDVYGRILAARMALVFVNTRSQAELTFQELWRINEAGLPIALHHGSLAVEQRRKVEAAMARGDLRAVVCTSTLDLGIDWGDVDLVIQMGAPKGAARLIQRIGRANHRMDEPSRALLVPSNRFEVLECRAAQAAVAAHDLDAEEDREGALDVLAQHVMARACGEPFEAEALYGELCDAPPYAGLSWETFEQIIDLVATGGYALRSYDRFRRIVKGPDGRWRARDAGVIQRHRMNAGAIVESPMLDVRLQSGRARPQGAGGGRLIGRIEEWYVDQLAPGDTFIFAGEVLRLEAVVGVEALVSRASASEPKVPSWQGGKFPLSTFLAGRVRAMIAEPDCWPGLPQQVADWLALQAAHSLIPGPDELLVETFARGGRHYLVAYPFEGRPAHNTLGMLLTRRLERLGANPVGFVASDYALSIWGMRALGDVDMDALFDEDMLGDDLDAWLGESVLMKRTFRHCAVIAGLIDRRRPGAEKSGRQVTFSTDLIYDVLARHEPDHILLKAAWADAGSGLLDVRRLGEGLARIKGRIRHAALTRVSPLAVPVMLEIGRESVAGQANEAVLEEAAQDLINDALRRNGSN